MLDEKGKPKKDKNGLLVGAAGGVAGGVLGKKAFDFAKKKAGKSKVSCLVLPSLAF